MSSLLLQLELALHAADCSGHASGFEGHGDKYTKLAKAAASVFPQDREPYWLRDRKLVQEAQLELIFEKLSQIESQNSLRTEAGAESYFAKIRQIFGEVHIGSDLNGQIIIYTGRQIDPESRTITPFEG